MMPSDITYKIYEGDMDIVCWCGEELQPGREYVYINHEGPFCSVLCAKEYQTDFLRHEAYGGWWSNQQMAIALCIVCLLSGCVRPQTPPMVDIAPIVKPLPDAEMWLTNGVYETPQGTVYVGMSSHELLDILGAPACAFPNPPERAGWVFHLFDSTIEWQWFFPTGRLAACISNRHVFALTWRAYEQRKEPK